MVNLLLNIPIEFYVKGLSLNDIIYSNSDDPEANLPEINIYDYLRDFFVDSASTKKYSFYLLQVKMFTILMLIKLVLVGVF